MPTNFNSLVKLFSILQLSKEQLLTGYLPAGLRRNDIPSLADHHYTCSLMGWLVSEEIKNNGGKINQKKVILMLMVHDLSELFGGDIAGPLNRKYPDLREHKDKIGERAIQLLSDFLGPKTKQDMELLWQEMESGGTDEAVVVKILDQMDHQFFLEHTNYIHNTSEETRSYRPVFVRDHIYALTERIKDQNTKKVMNDFLAEFQKNFFDKGHQAMNILMNTEATPTE